MIDEPSGSSEIHMRDDLSEYGEKEQIEDIQILSPLETTQ